MSDKHTPSPFSDDNPSDRELATWADLTRGILTDMDRLHGELEDEIDEIDEKITGTSETFKLRELYDERDRFMKKLIILSNAEEIMEDVWEE